MAAHAGEIVDALRAELAPVEQSIREHRYVELLEQRVLTRADLCLFAAAQTAIIASDRASFLRLAARHPWTEAGDFFLQMAAGEELAARHLAALRDALELGTEELAALEPPAGCFAYPSFVAWLSASGEAASTAVAFVANLRSWGENCRRMSAGLRGFYGLDSRATGFFDFFAEQDPGFEATALAVADEGFGRGESVAGAQRAARLLQAYELLYWDALADAAQR